ncbi:hypothetical protein KVV02_002298 [Mortierella alpina]|uniref:Uncharacterized protein n=1 Tax=Mortierella alpina TaxID=64518 RepID=A0A9P8A2K8_MORAP|nr:hypothetical protein KVV02_002298 [Mortierella alpina]
MGMPIDLPPLPSPTFRPTHSAKPSLSTAPDHQRTSSSPQTSPLPLDHAISPALVLVRQQHLQDNRPPLSSLAYDLPPPAVWGSSPFAGSPPAVDSMSSVFVVRGTVDAATIASTTRTTGSGGSSGSDSPPAMRTRPHPSLRRIHRMPAFVASRPTVGGGHPPSADHSAAVTAAALAALSSPNMEAHSLVHQLSRSLPPPPQYSPQTPQDAPTDYSLPQQQQGQTQEQATWNFRLVNRNHADNRGRMDVRSLLNSAGGHGQYYDELSRQLYYLEQAHGALPSGAEGQRTGVIMGNNDESDLAVQRQFWDRVHSQRRPSQAHGREHGREHGSGQGRGREHPREHAQETTSTRRTRRGADSQRAMEGVMVDSPDTSSSVRPSLSSSISSSSVSSPSPTSTSSTRSLAVSNPHSLLPMETIPSFLQDYSEGERTLIRADAFQPGVIHIYPENHAPIRMYGRPILSTSSSSLPPSRTSDPARHQLDAQDLVLDTTIASQTHPLSAAAVPLLSTSALPRMPSASLSPNSTSGELFRFTSTPTSPIPMRTSHQPVQGSYELFEGQTMEGASSLSDYTRMSVYATTASVQVSTLDHTQGPVQAAEAAEAAEAQP